MQVKLPEPLLTSSHHWSDGQGFERQWLVTGDENSGRMAAMKVKP